jgi:hypothetical protein
LQGPKKPLIIEQSTTESLAMITTLEVSRHRNGSWCLSDDGDIVALFTTEDAAYDARWSALSDDERQAITDEAEIDCELQAEALANRAIGYTA